MLDVLGIIFSSGMVLVVVLRAVQLDRSQPWFQTSIRGNNTAKAAPRLWQRRG